MITRRIAGEFKHIIDAKKRLALPAKIRENMTETMVLVGSIFSPCIALYPMDEWEKFEERLDHLSFTDGMEARRKIYSKLTEVTCDVHGRILIPQNLCEYAHLNRDVMVVGTGNFAEIWDIDLWDALQQKDDNEKIVAKLHDANF